MMRRFLTTCGLLAVLLLPASPAFAHEAPEGSEWVMADWMFMSFGAFAGTAILVFAIAWRRGLLSNLEDAKYYVLDIDEPDYYTPNWALADDTDDPNVL
jgi:hypothetical protein